MRPFRLKVFLVGVSDQEGSIDDKTLHSRFTKSCEIDRLEEVAHCMIMGNIALYKLLMHIPTWLYVTSIAIPFHASCLSRTRRSRLTPCCLCRSISCATTASGLGASIGYFLKRYPAASAVKDMRARKHVVALDHR